MKSPIHHPPFRHFSGDKQKNNIVSKWPKLWASPLQCFTLNQTVNWSVCKNIYGAVQIVVQKQFRENIINISSYYLLCSRRGSSRMYDTVWQEFRWPHMGRHVYQVVQEFHSCASNGGSIHFHHRNISLFPSALPLESISMYVLGPLPKKLLGYQHVLFIAERYWMLTIKVALKLTTGNIVAEAFVQNCVIPYVELATLHTNIGHQFFAKFFVAAYVIMVFKI